MTRTRTGRREPPLTDIDRSQELRDLAAGIARDWLTKRTRPQVNPTTGKVEELPISAKDIDQALKVAAVLEQEGEDLSFRVSLAGRASKAITDGKIKAAPALEIIDAELE